MNLHHAASARKGHEGSLGGRPSRRKSGRQTSSNHSGLKACRSARQFRPLTPRAQRGIRAEPGIWAVPTSNSAGLTIRLQRKNSWLTACILMPKMKAGIVALHVKRHRPALPCRGWTPTTAISFGELPRASKNQKISISDLCRKFHRKTSSCQSLMTKLPAERLENFSVTPSGLVPGCQPTSRYRSSFDTQASCEGDLRPNGVRGEPTTTFFVAAFRTNKEHNSELLSKRLFLAADPYGAAPPGRSGAAPERVRPRKWGSFFRRGVIGSGT
jgi:hypothetical protein